MWSLTQTYAFREGKVAYHHQGEGPPLILVHGTPSSSYIWRHCIEELAKERTVYYYDFIGYGASEKRDGQDVSLAAQTELLAELIRHWGLTDPEIVGHDFGGAVTLRTHLLKGQSFRRIVLMDPVALSPWGTDFARLVSKHTEVFEQLPDFIFEAMLSAYIRSACCRDIVPHVLEAYMRPWLGTTGQRAFFRQIAAFDEAYTDEVSGLYPSITAPVSILWGEEDTWIPIERGRELHHLIPGSSFYPIRQAGHFLQEDNMAEVLAFLKQWLKETI